MGWKFAATSATVGWRNTMIQLSEDTPWPDDDPFVIDRPDFFRDAPNRPGGSGLAPVGRPPQERAVTDGGRERRGGRRAG